MLPTVLLVSVAALGVILFRVVVVAMESAAACVDDADRMLQHMEHRGGCGCEDNTGDGAGMLTALPYELIEKISQELGEIKTVIPKLARPRK